MCSPGYLLVELFVVCVVAAADADFFFFFNDTATTEIYTLSLHDALPICAWNADLAGVLLVHGKHKFPPPQVRSEEHTSELQSHSDLVCRLLLEKKKYNDSDFKLRFIVQKGEVDTGFL